MSFPNRFLASFLATTHPTTRARRENAQRVVDALSSKGLQTQKDE
jgi:hypothetical protein